MNKYKKTFYKKEIPKLDFKLKGKTMNEMKEFKIRDIRNLGKNCKGYLSKK